MAKKAAAVKKAPAKEGGGDKKMYGVADVAEALGIQPASARIRLRNAEVEREGKTYEWPTKKAFDEVVKGLKSTGE